MGNSESKAIQICHSGLEHDSEASNIVCLAASFTVRVGEACSLLILGQFLSYWTCPPPTVTICGKEPGAPSHAETSLQGAAISDVSLLDNILNSMIFLTNILSMLPMEPYTLLSFLTAALGAAQLVGVVTPQTLASNDSLPPNQSQTS